jgi:hypothetical protein
VSATVADTMAEITGMRITGPDGLVAVLEQHDPHGVGDPPHWTVSLRGDPAHTIYTAMAPDLTAARQVADRLLPLLADLATARKAAEVAERRLMAAVQATRDGAP